MSSTTSSLNQFWLVVPTSENSINILPGPTSSATSSPTYTNMVRSCWFYHQNIYPHCYASDSSLNISWLDFSGSFAPQCPQCPVLQSFNSQKMLKQETTSRETTFFPKWNSFFFFLVALRVILNHYPALHFLTSSCLTVSLVCRKLSFPDSKHFITLLPHLQTFTLVASPASVLSPYSQIPLILWTLLKHRLKFESK